MPTGPLPFHHRAHYRGKHEPCGPRRPSVEVLSAYRLAQIESITGGFDVSESAAPIPV